MFCNPNNYVRIGVDRVGGPTKAARTLNVSNSAVHEWIRQRRVPNIDHARTLSGLCGLDIQKLRPTL